MKEITVLSGKGGTGKTSIMAAISCMADRAVFCDADVDASDLHLIFHPEIIEEHVFLGAWIPALDENTCNNCGICIDHCRFDAIHQFNGNKPVINTFQCEGCRLCERVCPEKAISSARSIANRWFVSSTRFGTMVHARMGPGEENSGKLVTEVRKKARQLALDDDVPYIITDGPPGIGCPVIASLTGTRSVLLITEPTLSGMQDVSRLVQLVNDFDIPMYGVINKYDINPEISGKIENLFHEKSIPLIGKIPYTNEMIDAMVAGKTINEYQPGSPLVKTIQNIWEVLKK
ncbi:MAG: ATP-binding protein [Bacteroidales bacterium]